MEKPRQKPAVQVTIRQARMEDVEAIHALVPDFARRGTMLPRSRAELYERLRDYEVAEADSQVVGCAALAIAWENLGEIRSLAVVEAFQGRGVGRRLVESCLAEARRLGIRKVFALTNMPAFFEHLGFERVDKETLPHKVWADCVKCPKFPDCDEEAVAIDVEASAA